LVKGQVTAIVTGVISVLIAVGYLVLVQVMDSRDMVPPVEEEAYGDGSVPAKVVVSAAESKRRILRITTRSSGRWWRWSEDWKCCY
jgi:hypothetical protein